MSMLLQTRVLKARLDIVGHSISLKMYAANTSLNFLVRCLRTFAKSKFALVMEKTSDFPLYLVNTKMILN
jgi:hypothetical protein